MGKKLESVLEFLKMSFLYIKKKKDNLINLTDHEKLLLDFSVFKSLNKFEIRALNNIVFERNYKAGEVIFQKNHPNIALYFIYEGQVELYDNELDENPTLELEKGNLLGSIEIFTGTKRLSTAIAKTPCHVLAISKFDFRNMVKNKPRIGSKILYSFCEKYSYSLYEKIIKQESDAKED